MATPYLVGEDDNSYYVAPTPGAEPRQVAKAGLDESTQQEFATLPRVGADNPTSTKGVPAGIEAEMAVDQDAWLRKRVAPAAVWNPNTHTMEFPSMEERNAAVADAATPPGGTPGDYAAGIPGPWAGPQAAAGVPGAQGDNRTAGTVNPEDYVGRAAKEEPKAETGGTGLPDMSELKKYERMLATQQRTYARERKAAAEDETLANLAEQNAITAQYNTEAHKTAAQAALMKQQDDAVRELEERQTTFNNARMAALDKGEQKIRESMSEFEKMSVDPQRFLNFGDNRAIAMISVALGTLGAGIGGGPNVALDMLNRNIDRDIDAQKQAMLNKRASIDDQRNLYSMNLQRFQDERQAQAVTRMQMIEGWKRQIEAQSMASESDAVKARGQVLIAQLNKQQAQHRSDVLMKENEIATRDILAQGDLGYKRLSLEQQGAHMVAQLGGKQAALAQAGFKGTGINDTITNEAIAKKNNTDILINRALELKKLIGAAKGSDKMFFTTEQSAKAAGAASALRQAARAYYAMRAPAGVDPEKFAEQFDEEIPKDPMAWRGNIVRAKLLGMIKDAKETARTTAKNAGFQLIDSRYAETGAEGHGEE